MTWRSSHIMANCQTPNNSIMTKRHALAELSRILTEDGCCSDIDESTVVAEIILENEEAVGDDDEEWTPSWLEDDGQMLADLVDNLGIDEEHAKSLLAKLNGALGMDDDSENDDPNNNSPGEDADDNLEGLGDSDSDGEYLDDGECEMCDRYIKLTKHHLIPKETWARMQIKLMHAAEAKSKGEMEKAIFLLGPGLENVVDELSPDKISIRRILQRTCDICRQCHTTVHRSHSNMDLALHHNTVDKLLEDESISKYCKWASKQRAGKYKR